LGSLGVLDPDAKRPARSKNIEEMAETLEKQKKLELLVPPTPGWVTKDASQGEKQNNSRFRAYNANTPSSKVGKEKRKG